MRQIAKYKPFCTFRKRFLGWKLFLTLSKSVFIS